MSVIAFDTLAYSERLQAAGVPRDQADAMAKANAEAFSVMLDARQLATKQDLERVKNELEEAITGVRHDLEGAIAETRNDLGGAMSKTRSDLEGAISDVRHEMKEALADTKHEILKWVMGMMIVQTTLILAALGIGIALLK